MSVRLLTKPHLEILSLKGGSTGLSESTLVKLPHCSKSHVTVHLSVISAVQFVTLEQFLTTSCSTGLDKQKISA